MKFKLLAGPRWLRCSPPPARPPQEGWYGAVDLGWHWPDDIENEVVEQRRQRPALRLGVQPGRRLGRLRPPRLPVEPTTGASNSKSATAAAISTASAADRTRHHRPLHAWRDPHCRRTGLRQARRRHLELGPLMGNVLYDIMPGLDDQPVPRRRRRRQPRQARSRRPVLERHRHVTRVQPAIQNLAIDDCDTAFAYQLHRRLRLESHRPTQRRPDLPLSGRVGRRLASVGTGALQPGVFSGEYRDQSVTLGLRYPFAAPRRRRRLRPRRLRRRLRRRRRRRLRRLRPAYEAKQFIVYFPFDQYVMTPEAQSVITEAANYAKAATPPAWWWSATPTPPARRSTTSACRNAAPRPWPTPWSARASPRPPCRSTGRARPARGRHRRRRQGTAEPPLDDRHQLLSRSSRL